MKRNRTIPYRQIVGLLLLIGLLVSVSAASAQKQRNGQGDNSSQGPDSSAFISVVSARTNLPADRLEVGNRVETDLPLTTVQMFEAKVLDKQTGQEYAVALDAAGKAVDADAARQAELTAHQNRYNKLQPSLSDKLATSNGRALPVAIWVHPPDLSDLRKDPNPSADVDMLSRADSDSAYQQYVAALQSRISRATGPVVAALARAGYQADAAGNAPLIAAELPASMITELASRSDVDAIFDASTAPENKAVGPNPNLGLGALSPDFIGGPRDLGRTVERIPQEENWAGVGLVGYYSKVAIVHPSGISFANPYLNNTTHQITQMNGNGSTGATALAGIIASTDGLARGRAWAINRLLAANYGTFNQTNVQNAGNWAVANGANIIDAAIYAQSTNSTGFDWLTVYFDYVASTTWQLVTASAGNGSSNYVAFSPAAGWNVLASGYLDTLGDPYGSAVAGTGYGPPTHHYGSISNFFTTMSDHSKPDVLAKGTSVYSTIDTSPWIGCADCGTGYYGSGDYAAAAAAGHAALISQANFNYFKVWPEVLRAIMIAGADDDVVRPTGADSRVKGLDGWAEAFQIRPQDNQVPAYQGLYLTPGSFDANGNLDLTGLRFNWGNLPVRVVLAWDGDPTTEGSDLTYHGLNADLDLQIIDANGNLVAYSAAYQQSREIIDTTLGGTAPYTIRIHRWRFTPGTHTYAGVSYSEMAYLSPQRDASLAPCLGPGTEVPPGGGIFGGDTRSGTMHWDTYQYDNGGGPGWTENGPERLYYKYTAVQGFLTATLTYQEPGNDLDVFIVQDSDREPPCGYDDPTHPFVHKHLVSFGDTQATYHVTQPGWYGFIVDGYYGSASQYTINIQWKPIQAPSGTPLPTLIPTDTPGATPPTPPSHDTPGTAQPTPTSAPPGTPEPNRTQAPTSTPAPASSVTPPLPPAQPTDTPAGPHITPTPCAIVFSDVPSTHTFYQYIEWLACNGIVGGYSDGTFRPGNNATRAQFTKMVTLGIGWSLLNPPSGSFEDVLPGSTFYSYIQTAFSHGIINGYPCGGTGEPCDAGHRPYFRPNNNITRGQLTKLLNLARGWALYTPVSPTFADVPTTNTFYQYIETTAHRGIASGYPCGGVGESCDSQHRPYFRPNNNGTRGQLSKMLYITLDLPQNP